MATAMNKLYASLNSTELTSRIIFKGSSMSPQSDRDAGFCSGGSEIGDERLSDSPNSQIDVSDDSIEVKIPHIVLTKNKRKNSEPAKVVETELGPLKKRIRFHQCLANENNNNNNDVDEKKSQDKDCSVDKKPSVFRPWTVEGPTEKKSPVKQPILSPTLIQIPDPPINPADVFVRHPAVTTLHRPPFSVASSFNDEQMEPLALVVDRKEKKYSPSNKNSNKNNVNIKQELPQVKSLKQMSHKPTSRTPSIHDSFDETSQESLAHHKSGKSGSSSGSQRNYKNMTRERRIEANARERTRVHTISAAYETLRKCIPSYSSSHKLSKLAVLRIAGAYILALSRMMGEDLSADGSQPDVNECIDAVRNILEREGKVKKEDDTD
uniref:CSON001627 protein n=1 Tax=Culicoides sonorensis TaxID=179676 RepID=A0A336L0X6_CULSO